MGERERERDIERAEKYDAGDGISHCKVFQATATEDDRKDDREEDTDARRKGERARERKAVSVDGRLLRPSLCSRSFPLNSSAGGSGADDDDGERDSYTRRTRGCERMESRDDARERRERFV